MGKTVVIDGKTYNERSIDHVVVDGHIINGDLIPEEYAKKGEMVILDINVKSSEEDTFTVSNKAISESVETMDVNIENESAAQVLEKETFIKKVIKSVIRFLNKFIS